MAVPAYNEFYPFILKALEDKREYELSEIRDKLKELMNLTEEDLNEMVPSNTQTVFVNRANWACVYLTKGGILKRPTRGVYVLTKKGEAIIKERGYNVKKEDLLESKNFREFTGVDETEDPDESQQLDEIPDITPEVQIDEAFKVLNKELAEELLTEIMHMSPIFFEKMVLDFLYEMGYGGKDKERITHTSYSQDDGIDGLIKEDELGLDYIYVQAKRWSRVVGQPEIQRFSGALSGQGANKGIFITTSWFSSKAINFAENLKSNRIILIDGKELTKLMITYGVGLTVNYNYKLQKIDKDYFIED